MEDDVARFVIDGREYPVPDLDSITMGEAIIVYDYSGMGLDQLQDNANHPGLVAAFMHIAYQRQNPGEPKTTVRTLIENTSLVAALEKITGDETNPQERKTEARPSLLPSSSSSDASSGAGSPNGSEEQADAQPNTGATKSATLHI